MISSGAETLISVAMLAEVRSRLGREADDFVVAVGERIGAACAFDFSGGMDAFTETMNGIWKELGFGKALVQLQSGALAIRHQLPDRGQDVPAVYETLPLLVEGIYRSWFHNLSPHGSLARVAVSESEVEFIFSE